MTIDLNCDMGEGMPNDADIMPYISSANIACGYHAGNENTIRKTIELCKQYNVAVGVHPGFDDKPNFGRKAIQVENDELYRLIWNQLEIIHNICEEMGAALHHVKPHGALYNMAAKDKAMSHVIARAVYDFNPSLVYYGLSGSVMISEAKAIGLKTANEVFADRTYQADGTLTPRSQPNALISDTITLLNQMNQMIEYQSVIAVNGEVIPIHVDTICIHGDGPYALDFVQQINSNLLTLDIEIKAL